jgi:hypothetical protein
MILLKTIEASAEYDFVKNHRGDVCLYKESNPDHPENSGVYYHYTIPALLQF